MSEGSNQAEIKEPSFWNYPPETQHRWYSEQIVTLQLQMKLLLKIYKNY